MNLNKARDATREHKIGFHNGTYVKNDTFQMGRGHSKVCSAITWLVCRSHAASGEKEPVAGPGIDIHDDHDIGIVPEYTNIRAGLDPHWLPRWLWPMRATGLSGDGEGIY